MEEASNVAVADVDFDDIGSAVAAEGDGDGKGGKNKRLKKEVICLNHCTLVSLGTTYNCHNLTFPPLS